MTGTEEFIRSMIGCFRGSSNGDCQRRIYEDLLETGSHFTTLNLDLSAEFKERWDCRLKECFYNCQRLASYSGYRYFEGYALGIIPVHHAWLVDGKDRIIDPTWILKEEEEESADYFGIEIPIEVIMDVWKTEYVARGLLWEFISRRISNE